MRLIFLMYLVRFLNCETEYNIINIFNILNQSTFQTGIFFMPKIKLSAVIITLNEEKNIGRCIDSLMPVADEFIIIDSFSTDKTIDIIKSKGLTTTQRKWEGYSDTKNFANSLCTGDFILSIDADEELSPQLIQSIRAFKQDPTADVLEVNRLTNYCGQWIRHSGWYPEYKTRIFRKGLATWKGSIHEELIFTQPPTSEKLKGDLLHYSYPTIESHFKKVFQYAKLAAEKNRATGKSNNLFIHGLLKPWFMFVRKYFLKLGFLDGFYGFVIAVVSAVERFLRYVYFRQITKKR
jgi:glycosyltransferase involved in cell wall biosynthesis